MEIRAQLNILVLNTIKKKDKETQESQEMGYIIYECNQDLQKEDLGIFEFAGDGNIYFSCIIINFIIKHIEDNLILKF